MDSKKYESVLLDYKAAREKFSNEAITLESKLHELATKLIKTNDSLTMQINDANKNLSAEQEKSTFLENKLLASEQLNKELTLIQEQSGNNWSEVAYKTQSVQALEKQLSITIIENEKLLNTVEELRQMISEKERILNQLQTSNVALEDELEKQKESNKHLKEELVYTKQEMTESRQEMMASVDQYREQYIHELKETEDQRKALQYKYENTCKELENIMEQKNEKDANFLKLEETIKTYDRIVNEKENTIKELREKMEKEQKTCVKKKRYHSGKLTKVKNSVTHLQEEKFNLEKVMQNIKTEPNSGEVANKKIVSLKAQKNISQEETRDFRGTCKNLSGRGISTTQDTVQAIKHENHPPKKRKRKWFY